MLKKKCKFPVKVKYIWLTLISLINPFVYFSLSQYSFFNNKTELHHFFYSVRI